MPDRGQNPQMNTTLDESPGRPKKTALQKIQEQFERQMRPLRQIQKMQDLAERYSPGYQLRELTQQLDSSHQMQELFQRSMVPQHIQDIIDGASITTQAKRVMEQYFPKGTFADLGLNTAGFGRAAGFDSISNIVKQHEQNLKSISEHQQMFEMFQRQVFGRRSDVKFARQLEEKTSPFREIEEAKKSLDRLWLTLRPIDLSQFESSEQDERETEQAAESITKAAAEQESLQEAVDRIITAIQAQPKPNVQLMLWLFFRKVLDWLIAGAIGAAMGHYAPAVLGESPQAAKKAVRENARTAVGSPQLLAEYRYVSAKVLIVRQNPRARSPEVGRLSFGKVVKLVKKDRDFALILWTDKESGAEIQGWVFSRHLGKFK